MICETCRYSGRPGFVRAEPTVQSELPMVPCPDCGGQGISHCCDGICAQPSEPLARDELGAS